MEDKTLIRLTIGILIATIVNSLVLTAIYLEAKRAHSEVEQVFQLLDEWELVE